MAYIPDDAVMRCIEDPVQGNSQLYNAKTGAKVASCLPYGEQEKLPQLIGKLEKLAAIHAMQLGRGRYTVQ